MREGSPGWPGASDRVTGWPGVTVTKASAREAPPRSSRAVMRQVPCGRKAGTISVRSRPRPETKGSGASRSKISTRTRSTAKPCASRRSTDTGAAPKSKSTVVVTPGATDPNGIKVRVPGIKSFQLTGEALGYIPAPIPFSEAFTAVQTGVVEGVIGSGAEGYYASFRDVTKTYIPANTHFEVWFMIISNDSLSKLSEADAAALRKEAEAFEAKRWEVAEADQGKNEQKLVDAGATRVSLSDAELAAMSDKVRATVWPQILEDIGKDWGQAILDKVAAAN